MSATSFDPEKLARDAGGASALALRVERVPDGIRWARAPFRRPHQPCGSLLEGMEEAWSRVLDALAFRHERIVNLPYVDTATQAEALERLARALGLKPTPPLAASTWLALTVQPLAGRTTVDVPAGLAVQSVPVGNARPQVFESDAPLSARPEWNAIAVQPPPPALARIATDATHGLVASAGLAKGDRLAVSGTVAGAPFAAAVTLTAVDVASAASSSRQRLRRLGWGEPLAGQPGALPIDGATAVELGPSASLFGAAAQSWSSVPDAVRYALSAPRGGLRRLARPLSDGSCADRPLGAFACIAGEANAVATSGGAWLASSSRGLFRSTDEGATWSRSGLRTWAARALCASDSGLYVGTASHGVIRSVDAGVTWEVLRGGTVVTNDASGVVIALGRLPRCSVGALGVFPSAAGSALVLAGTNAGLYYQQLGDPAWYPHADGLPLVGSRSRAGGPAITAVVVEPATGALIVGTSQGLFRATGLDNPWQALGVVGDATPISALGLDPFGALLIGLEAGGLYRMTSAGTSVVGPDADNPFIRAGVRSIAVSAGSWWVGTDEGCFWSADGVRWTRLLAEPVRSIAQLDDGGALVAARLDGSQAEEWPGFTLPTDQLDLDRLYPRAMPGLALVLDAHDVPLLVRVRRVSETWRSDFGIKSRVTRLEIDPEPRLSALSRRATRVLPAVRDVGPIGPELELAAAAAQITLAQLPASELWVDAELPDLSGRAVIVSGPALRTRLPAGTQLTEADSGASLLLHGDTSATLASVPVVSGKVMLVRIVTVDGLAGTVSVPELPLLAGDPRSAPLVALRNVVGVERRPEGTCVTLDVALGLPFDPTAISLYGNVVSATHAQHVDPEVLGSGDPNRGDQRFKLLQPLCWTEDDSGAFVPALEVQVSGHTWQRVEQRADAGPHDRTYSVETDMRGATYVQFGDGHYGARPSAGVENIVARYRSGGGAAGNQPAGAIRLLKNRPPGVKAARNLLPATGGADAEPHDALRARIPLHARLPECVISLPDYVDHLATLGGIAKSAVSHLWNGHAHVVHITLATTDAANGWALDPSSALAASLRALARQTPIVFDSVEIAWFAVALDVAVAGDVDAAPVLAAVELALMDAFGFGARDIGDAVLPSALVRVAMGVAGVTNAALRRLGVLGETGSSPRTDALPGAGARRDPVTGALLPGRLWVLAPPVPRPAPGTQAATDSVLGTRIGRMGAT